MTAPKRRRPAREWPIRIAVSPDQPPDTISLVTVRDNRAVEVGRIDGLVLPRPGKKKGEESQSVADSDLPEHYSPRPRTKAKP